MPDNEEQAASLLGLYLKRELRSLADVRSTASEKVAKAVE